MPAMTVRSWGGLAQRNPPFTDNEEEVGYA
jgi:hypothetical protein